MATKRTAKTEQQPADARDDRTEQRPEREADEVTMSDAEVTARKTGPDAREDGKFRHTFTVLARDYNAGNHGDMHRANCVATLQEALNRGLHPRGEAALESEEPQDPPHWNTNKQTVKLTYAVDVVPASRDGAPADTVTPSAALKGMGGSTVGGGEEEQSDGSGGNARK